MSSTPVSLSPSKTPARKRTRGLSDDLQTNEAKRRRSSLPHELLLEPGISCDVPSAPFKADSRDRFLPALTTVESYYPLTKTSPRSSRLARSLGLVQPRLLSFHDDSSALSPNHQFSDTTLPMRTHFSQKLTHGHSNAPSAHSAANHARMKPDRVLDAGPMNDFPLHPCAWSSKDLIAAVIRGRIFTHSMTTNTVSSLTDFGAAECVEWTSDTELAIGHNWGGVLLINAETNDLSRHFLPVLLADEDAGSNVNALNWNRERGVLAVGLANGTITYHDPRVKQALQITRGQGSDSVVGIKWSSDGLFLASGHEGGIVKCIDWRVNKTFDLKMPHRKTAHKGTVKSITWAPWNSRLLATGGSASDHTVRIWSLSKSDAAFSCKPVHTLSFSSGISSLHFSPHTTEFLSTHGEPVSDVSSSPPTLRSHFRRRPTSIDGAGSPPAGLTRHSVLVHSYPSLQRVHTVLDAHGGPIVDSVLAPDGTRVMTFGEDETLRIWTVWGTRKQVKVCNMINKYRIR